MQFMQALSDFDKKNLEEYSFRKNQSYDRKHMQTRPWEVQNNMIFFLVIF